MDSWIKVVLLAIALLLPLMAHGEDDQESEADYFYAAKERLTIGVMEFKGVGLPQETADVIADIVSKHISKLGDVRVVSKADIVSMLDLEKQRRLAGCTDKECLSKIAGALGMQWMVTGNVSVFGKSIILNLKLFDVRNAYVAGRAMRRVKGDVDDLLDELPDTIEELFEKVAHKLGISVTIKTVTSSARHRQQIGRSPSAITVITREQIENTACLDVICLLRGVPEVDVLKITTGYVAVGARALTSAIGDKVLVLVDGMEVNEEVFGLIFWQTLPIHLEDIERIEVIRGPGSALYGANAHSAVVSITTRQTTDSRALAFVGGGESDNLSLFLKLDQRLGNWGFQLSGSKQTSGYREVGRVHFRVDRKTDEASSVLKGGVAWEMGEIYTKLGWIDTTKPALNGHVLLSHQSDSFKAQMYFRTMQAYLDVGFPVYFQDTELGRFPDEIEFLTTNLDTEIQYNWSPWIDNLLIIGGNYRWNSFFTKDNSPEETHQHRVGLFLQNEQLLFDNLMITAGLRFDYNNISPEAWSPRLAMVWEVQEDHHLRAAFGRAFRKPSLLNTSIHFKNVKGIEGIEDFFEKSIGSPDLDNESITTLEAGYIGHFFNRLLTAETDVFYNRFRDTIAFNVDIVLNSLGIPDLARSSLNFRNAGMEVDSLGGCLSLSFRAALNLRLSLNYTLRYSWYVSDPGDITGDVEGVAKGDRVPWEPAHLINASMHYLPESGFRFGASLHAASATDVAWTEDGSAFGNPVVIHNPARLFVSGFAAWRINYPHGWWEVGVRAYNVFHSVFRDYPTVIQPDGSELGGQRIGRRLVFFLKTGM